MLSLWWTGGTKELFNFLSQMWMNITTLISNAMVSSAIIRRMWSILHLFESLVLCFRRTVLTVHANFMNEFDELPWIQWISCLDHIRLDTVVYSHHLIHYKTKLKLELPACLLSFSKELALFKYCSCKDFSVEIVLLHYIERVPTLHIVIHNR